MVIEIQKKEKETSQSLIRRFSRRMRRSGLLLRIRRSRFFKRSRSHQMKKRAALRKQELRKEYEKKKKLGKA